MRKILFILFLTITATCYSENSVDLLPNNMVNYIGKMNRQQFEELVGNSVSEQGGFIYYDVFSIYDNNFTTIKCAYRETDGKLSEVSFTANNYMGYWMSFAYLKGYKEKINCRVKNNAYGETVSIYLHLNNFHCRIYDIKEIVYDYFTTLTKATIRYSLR